MLWTYEDECSPERHSYLSNTNCPSSIFPEFRSFTEKR